MYTFCEDCYYPTRLLVSDLGSYWDCPQCMWSGEVFDITQRPDLANPNEIIPFCPSDIPKRQDCCVRASYPAKGNRKPCQHKDDYQRAVCGTGLVFIDVSDWVNARNKVLCTGADAVHPSTLGHKFIGAREALTVRVAGAM